MAMPKRPHPTPIFGSVFELPPPMLAAALPPMPVPPEMVAFFWTKSDEAMALAKECRVPVSAAYRFFNQTRGSDV